MFGELPKIFDRNFVVAFFLPAAFFIMIFVGILANFHVIAWPFGSLEDFKAEGLTAMTMLSLASLLVALILLALNFDIYRFLEGYPFDSFASLKWLQRRRYNRQRKTLLSVEEEMRPFLETGIEPPTELWDRRDALLLNLTNRWPDNEAHLLPTAFGNTIRAFEVYSRQMYGIDAIPGWTRLQAVIPKDYRSLIDEAKALADFWVNLWVACYLVLIAWIVVVIHTRRLMMLWLPAIIGFLCYVVSRRSRSEAESWGDIVKAAFDVFLPRLQSKLEFPARSDSEEAKQQWQSFSQAMIYGIPDSLPSKAARLPTTLVFQYGSNADSAHLNSDKRLKGDARAVGIAHTKYDFELDFTVWSVANECAAADIVPGRGRKIWGVLYEIPERLIKRESSGNRKSLDAIEGEGMNYWRTEIAVTDPKNPLVEIRAVTYIAITPKPGLHTKIEYVSHIVVGLREHNVPAEYIEYVKGRIIGNDPSLFKAVEVL